MVKKFVLMFKNCTNRKVKLRKSTSGSSSGTLISNRCYTAPEHSQTVFKLKSSCYYQSSIILINQKQVNMHCQHLFNKNMNKHLNVLTEENNEA